MGVTSLCSPIRSFLSAQPTPHPSRVPMKCIGIAGHPLPKGEGEQLIPGPRGLSPLPNGEGKELIPGLRNLSHTSTSPS